MGRPFGADADADADFGHQMDRAAETAAAATGHPELERLVLRGLFGEDVQAKVTGGESGRYRVERLIGRGGMAAVYRAYDTVDGRVVALKRFTRSSGDEALYFRREFHTLLGLKHPHVVNVYEYGVDDLGPYYAMELLEGGDLRGCSELDPAALCRLLRDIALALSFLHGKRLVHRDLTLSNIRLGEDGAARLIDFGLLATLGAAVPVAGTPPFVAPEALYGRPLDQRADLFALGAIAYWLLCGRHAFPAGEFEDLPPLWQRRPAPPSSQAEVPESLSQLVLSLLHIDPMARPSSAVEVIDRLAGMGGVAPTTQTRVAQSYLASVPLVGRAGETERLGQLLARAEDGQGGAMIISAPTGMGKTRLLNELAVEMKLRALPAAQVGAPAGQGPFAVIRAVARALLVLCPEVAMQAARAHAGVLSRVMPEITRALGPTVPPAPLRHAEDPAEDRMILHEAVRQWLLGLGRPSVVGVIIDDIQRADEPSVAALAAAASSIGESRLLIVAGHRTDEPASAPSSLADFAARAVPIALGPFSREEMTSFVIALWGDIANAASLGRLMHEVSGGIPLLATELAQHVVDRHLVRYQHGTWTIPQQLPQVDLPRHLAEAIDLRVQRLAPPTRALAQALGLFGPEIALSMCVRLAGASSESEVFGALDELVEQGVLVGVGNDYRFRHDGLREALLRSLDETTQGRLHLRIASALGADDTVAADRELEVGWHLLHGGKALRAARLLESAGRRLYAQQAVVESIAPLEAAIEIYEAHPETSAPLLELYERLMTGGGVCNHPAVYRHAASAVGVAWNQSGLALAERIARVFGKRVGLIGAFGWMTLRWLVGLGRARSSPVLALKGASVIGAAACLAFSHTGDMEAMRELVRRMEVLSGFSRRLGHTMFLIARATLHLLEGRVARTRRDCAKALEILRGDRRTPLSDFERRAAEAWICGTWAWAELVEHDPHCRQHLDRIAELDLLGFGAMAVLFRAIYHRLRGEEAEAVALLEYAEERRVLTSQAHMWDQATAAWSGVAYGLSGDLVGLRASLEEIERICARGARIQANVALSRGEYLRETHRFDQAREVLRAAIETLPDAHAMRGHLLRALAETIVAQGRDFDQAAGIAREGIAHCSQPDVDQRAVRLRCECALALAEAGQGRVAAAVARLDAALQEAAPLASPTLSGALHEARARVALQAGDPDAFEAHVARAEGWYRPTENPVLIARVEALRAAASFPSAGKAG